MNTTISVSLPRKDALKTRKLALERGFDSVSEYLRFLLAEDDSELISAAEIVRRSKEAVNLHKKGKLIEATSLADLL